MLILIICWLYLAIAVIPSITKNENQLPEFQQICSCSRRSIDQINFLIIGGKPANPNKYPEVVILNYNNYNLCGGTVLNKDYILTAAHCVYGKNISLFIVIAGSNTIIDDFQPNRVELGVKRAIIHPEFSFGNTLFNDIALLELNTPLHFNPSVQPTCLPLKVKNYDGKAAIVVGWGQTEEQNQFASDNLNEVTMPIVSNPICQNLFTGRYPIYYSMICAGLDKGGKDSCNGDSGGPLFAWGSKYGMLKQIGITSFGFPNTCGQPKKPGVYTRTDYMISFMLESVNNNQDCKVYGDKY